MYRAVQIDQFWWFRDGPEIVLKWFQKQKRDILQDGANHIIG